MHDALRTVWILGSGFSKGLGGPLLYDLLSDRAGLESKAKQPSMDLGWVYKIFAEHQRGNDASRGKSVHWDHAEDFLTFVDSTAKSDLRKQLLVSWLQGTITTVDPAGDFRRKAKFAVALECDFLREASVDTDEAWSPYVRWARNLSPEHDTIVTFNYDLVLEKLGDAKHLVNGVKTPVVETLGRKSVARADGAPVAHLPGVPILKLHGSVDWLWDGDSAGSTRGPSDLLAAYNKGNVEPLICTPGQGKRVHSREALGTVWEAARTALRQADVVVLLGYRSPPSDADARTFILEAISAVPETTTLFPPPSPIPRNRIVHLVLGPRTTDDAVVRLESLVQFAMRASGRVDPVQGHPSFQVFRQPLFVEDFLSVYHPAALYGSLVNDK